jgi:hypothetical protein
MSQMVLFEMPVTPCGEHALKIPLNPAMLERLAQKEKEFELVRKKTVKANALGFTYGVSFYGFCRDAKTHEGNYKRIEVWMKRAPLQQEFDDLLKLFSHTPPKLNNTCYVADKQSLWNVNP